MRNVAEIGLNILLVMLQKFSSNSEAGPQFFQTYFLDLMQHIFSVVTDTSHTASMCDTSIICMQLYLISMSVFVIE